MKRSSRRLLRRRRLANLVGRVAWYHARARRAVGDVVVEGGIRLLSTKFDRVGHYLVQLGTDLGLPFGVQLDLDWSTHIPGANECGCRMLIKDARAFANADVETSLHKTFRP